MTKNEAATNKLILGTAQLGLNYGINNHIGKPSKTEVYNILDYAHEAGIRILDTAEAYGDSIQLIGSYHKDHKTKKFDIISKFKMPKDGILDTIVPHLQENMNELNIDYFWAYLFHSFADYETQHRIINELYQQKKEGRIRYIGVSIYTNYQFEQVINDDKIDLIQLPFNLFDNYNLRGELMQKAKEKNKLIHTRSVFLQGLFFKDPALFPNNLISLSQSVNQLQQISRENKISIASLCLNYSVKNKLIDGVLLGIDNLAQLKQNINELYHEINPKLFKEIEHIIIKEPQLLNPSIW